MGYLAGSSDTSAYTTSFGYRTFSIPAAWHSDLGKVASSSGTATFLDLYIDSWGALDNIVVGLYEDRTLIATMVVNSSAGTGIVEIPITGTPSLTSGNTYRVSILCEVDAPLNLWSLTGDNLKYHDQSSYPTMTATLPVGITSTQNEYYWAIRDNAAPVINNIDGDNNVYQGQSTVTINTTNFPTSVTTWSADISGDALTKVGWNSGNPQVTIPVGTTLRAGNGTLNITYTE